MPSPQKREAVRPVYCYVRKKYYLFLGAMKFATLTVSLLIIVAVLMPGDNLPDIRIGGYDKLIHIGMFLLWGLAVRYDFTVRFTFVHFLAAGVAFSLMTEVLQIAIEGRSFDVYDMLADVAGLLLGLWLGGPLARRWRSSAYRERR